MSLNESIDVDIENVSNSEVLAELNKKVKGRTVFKKLSSTEWRNIEIVVDDYTKNVYNTLISMITNEIVESNVQIKACGSKIYLEDIRPNIFKHGVINIDMPVIKYKNDTSDKEKNKNKKKKGMTRDEIIEQQNSLKVKNNIIEILTALKDTNETITAFMSKYVELKLVGLMSKANYFLKLIPSELNVRRKNAFELICGSNKNIEIALSISGTSIEAIEDLRYLIKLLCEKVKFTNKIMLTTMPKLAISTDYDTIFPKTGTKPYPSQIELINKVREDNQSLIFFISMIGTGKTTMIAPLSKYVEQIQTHYKSSGIKKKYELLFACSVEPVRHQVGSIAYNCSIKFGIGSSGDKTVRVVNHFSTDDTNRSLVIADLTTALELLTTAKDRNTEYMLFIDEPTVGADQENHPITRLVVQLLEKCPPLTILSSATMPKSSELPDIVELYKSNYPLGKIKEVVSLESKIGCQVFNSDRVTIAPHVNCNNKEELYEQINKIIEMPFLRRIYTPLMMYHLYDKMISNGISSELLPDLEKIFNIPSNLSQNNVENIAISLLKIIYNNANDDTIKKICSLENIKISEDLDDIKDIHENKYDIFDTNKIFLSHSHYYLGNCLIACLNPVQFALEAGNELIIRIKKIGGLKKFVKEYEDSLDVYNEKLIKFNQKHDLKDEEASKGYKRADISRVDNKEIKFAVDSKKRNTIHDKNEKADDMRLKEGIIKPVFSFPPQLQINTLAFIKIFNPSIIEHLEKSVIRSPLINQYHDLGVDDDIMLLLLCGVGIYSNSSDALTQEYLEAVLHYAEKGELAFVISDESICYGANYPFGHVIVEDEFALKHSIGTMFQLWGRAGRIGKSWSANAHLTGKKSEYKFMEYLKGKTDKGTKLEAINISKALSLVIEEREAIKKDISAKKLMIIKMETDRKNKNEINIQTLNKLQKEEENKLKQLKEKEEIDRKNKEILKIIQENELKLKPYEKPRYSRMSKEEIEEIEVSVKSSAPEPKIENWRSKSYVPDESPKSNKFTNSKFSSSGSKFSSGGYVPSTLKKSS
jgi:hypothetical protein